MNHILKISSIFLLAMLLAASPGCAGSQSQVGSQLKEAINASNNDSCIRTVHVGDIDMAYKILGNSSGEPLLMIMGFKAGMDIWDPRLLSNLSAHNRVIIFDNRGMGYTTAPDGNFTMAELSNDTLGLMNALRLTRPTSLDTPWEHLWPRSWPYAIQRRWTS